MASQIINGYAKAMNRIKNTYDAKVGALDEEYLARNREINRENIEAKNRTSANYKLSLDEAQKSLLDRGLSKSGEAVNTEILSNLSKNSAFAALDAQAQSDREENALSRSREKSELISDRLKQEQETENSMLEALRNQYNLDRNYDLQLSENAEDTRRWNEENEEDKRRWEAEQSLAERKTAVSEGELALKKSDAQKQSIQTAASQIKNTVSDALEKLTGNGGIVGKIKSIFPSLSDEETTKLSKSPEKLVQEMYEEFQRKDYSSEDVRNYALASAVYDIVNDYGIDEDYRKQVRIYAHAMGYI